MAASNFLTGTHHRVIFQGEKHGATHRGFKECELHPGHKEFMTVDEFLNKNPSEIGLSKTDMLCARNLVDRTVRVIVTHTSIDRPDTYIKPYPFVGLRGNHCWVRYGTGCILQRCDEDISLDRPCPCSECKHSTCQTPDQKSYYFIVKTATHIIFDEQEAQNAVFELFYDSEDRSKVVKIFGIGVLDSRLLRMQTDRSLVVCVTHNGTLAEKLDLLCDQNLYTLPDKVLVSHPHGVSKRISIGDYPDKTILTILNESSVKLKKGMNIRFPGCDATHVIQDIHRFLDKRVIVHDDVSNTFTLDCDLTVFRPEGVIMETDYFDYVDYEDFKPIPKNTAWCNVSFPGTQLQTGSGNQYTFPLNDDKAQRVRMEVFGKTEYFFDKSDKDKHSVFVYSRYNMASCPGSSGAHVGSFGSLLSVPTPGNVHLGDSGDCNTISLFCIHTPDDEQESETNQVNLWWYNDYKRYKQGLYDQITGK